MNLKIYQYFATIDVPDIIWTLFLSIYIYSFTPKLMLSYNPHICYHNCMKSHHTYPLAIFMLKYGYASASNVIPI